MDPPRSRERDESNAPPSGPRSREAQIAALYAEHWPYVLAVLPSYGVPEQDAEDVAQTAWMHVYRRRDSYDPTTHKTPRAWITGFVQRCAANHRRTQRRGPIPVKDAGEQHTAPGLSPEDAAILRDVGRLIPNEEQRIALLLHYRHGLTIAEIAAIQEVTEIAVKGRLAAARRALMNDNDEKKSPAFLGFGTMEALAEAMKPRPIPPEVGERHWQKIAEQIRQEEAAHGDTSAPPSQPPAAALPSQAPHSAPAFGSAGKMTAAGALLLLVFLTASVAWRVASARASAPSSTSTAATTTASTAATTTAAPSSTPTSSTSTAATTTAAPSSTPTSSTSTAATTTASTATPTSSTTGADSQRLLARMREAMHAHQFSTVLALASQHAQQFGAANVREREALRVEALRQTGRSKEAAEHARAVLNEHPEHRRSMERAAGQALP